jgi:hypothetical protein
MYFELNLTIREIQLEIDLVEFDYGGVHKIKVTLSTPTEDDKSAGYTPSNFFCKVSGQWEPKENILAVFTSLAEKKVPKGSKASDEWKDFADQNGNTTAVVPLRLLSDPFISFANQVRSELNDYARRTVNVLRWRCATEGPHNPISVRFGGEVWSLDQIHWELLPGTLKAYMSLSPYLRISDVILEDVKTYVEGGKNQPLSHELYLEAWEQRHLNPRSALVIGIAAVETGLKLFISDIVPGAKWLIENAPSPDVIKMLSEYLPLLPLKRKVNKRAFAPKSEIYETLKKGVQIRNQITHGRAIKVNYETLEEILFSIHDVLWILDYCSGYDWALEHVRPDIRKVLTEQEHNN